MITPRCPYCNKVGVEFISKVNMDDFLIVYCEGCGAIHGVLPLPIESKAVKVVKSDTRPVKPINKKINPYAIPVIEEPVKPIQAVKKEVSPQMDSETAKLAAKYGPKNETGKQTKSEIGAMLAASKGGLFNQIFKKTKK